MSVPRELEIQAEETRAGFTLTTVGLERLGRRELEMVGVRPDALNDAAAVLNALSAHVANRRQVSAGELFGAELRVAHLVVRVVEPPSAAGWPRPVALPLPPLRVIAPEPDAPLDAPPSDALATVVLEKAERALEREDEAEADAELVRAIALFPGDPERREGPRFDGTVHNRQNHLGYLMLARRRGLEGASLYRDALERCASFEATELGTSRAELARLDAVVLERMARAVIDENLAATWLLEHAGERVGVFASPVWKQGEKGRVARDSALLALESAALYYEGDAARALRHPETSALIAAVILAHAREPSALLARTWPAQLEWRDPHAPSLTTSKLHQPGVGLVSLLLAELALLAAAGCDRRELAAALGLATDPKNDASAGAKLGLLFERTAAWQSAALADWLA